MTAENQRQSAALRRAAAPVACVQHRTANCRSGAACGRFAERTMTSRIVVSNNQHNRSPRCPRLERYSPRPQSLAVPPWHRPLLQQLHARMQQPRTELSINQLRQSKSFTPAPISGNCRTERKACLSFQNWQTGGHPRRLERHWSSDARGVPTRPPSHRDSNPLFAELSSPAGRYAAGTTVNGMICGAVLK